MELVTVILLFEGLDHCMVVFGWHMAYREEITKAPNRPEFMLPASRSGFISILVIFRNFSQGNPYPMRREPTGTHNLTACRHDDSMDLVELPEVLHRNPSPVNCTEESCSFEFRRGRSGMAREARVSRVPCRSRAARTEFKDRVAQG